MGGTVPGRRAEAGAAAVGRAEGQQRRVVRPGLEDDPRHDFDPKLGGVDWNAVRDELRPRVENAESRRGRPVGDPRAARPAQGRPISHLPRRGFGAVAAATSAVPGDGEAGLDVRVVDGKALVTAVAADSRAAKAGVKAGLGGRHDPRQGRGPVDREGRQGVRGQPPGRGAIGLDRPGEAARLRRRVRSRSASSTETTGRSPARSSSASRPGRAAVRQPADVPRPVRRPARSTDRSAMSP